jgi:hypothetical protein
VAFLLHVHEISASNLGPETVFWFSGIPQSLEENARVVSQIKP